MIRLAISIRKHATRESWSVYRGRKLLCSYSSEAAALSRKEIEEIKLKPRAPSHLARIKAMDLHVTSYLRDSVAVAGDGHRLESLPCHMIGRDLTLIVWCEKDGRYSFAGWEPYHDGMHGGRRESIHSVLNWVERARDVRAGRAQDFRGC